MKSNKHWRKLLKAQKARAPSSDCFEDKINILTCAPPEACTINIAPPPPDFLQPPAYYNKAAAILRTRYGPLVKSIFVFNVIYFYKNFNTSKN